MIGTSSMLSKLEAKRRLTKDEIVSVLSFIYPLPSCVDGCRKHLECRRSPFEAALAVADRQRANLAGQIQDIELYPSAIPRLRDNLQMRFTRAHIDPGKSVGALASTSIGERNTQSSLSCVDWNERVVIIRDGKCVETFIGALIDDIIESSNVRFHDNYCETDPSISETDLKAFIERRDVNNMWIPAVDENGHIAWRKIEAVMRHPLYNRLLKVELRSGRSVIATSAKSFLTRKENKIVATAGSELRVGDRLPVAVRIPAFETVGDNLNLYDVVSPKKYIFGTELWKCRRVRDEYHKQENRLWWKATKDIRFIVPFRRPDTAMASLEGTKKEKIGREDIREGFVYTMSRKAHIPQIPEKLQLDREFGFFVGAYLAEGCVTEQYISIANYDQGFLARIKAFADKYNIGTHQVSIGYKYKYFNSIAPSVSEHEKKMEENTDSAEIRLHSHLMAEIIMTTCGKYSINKHIPTFAYTAPKEFISGLLDGYFSGDGTVNVRDCRVHCASISLHLLHGLSWLLSRLNIYTKIEANPRPEFREFRGRKCPIQQSYTLTIACENLQRFRENMSFTIAYKQERLDQLKNTNHRYTYSQLDIIPGINYNSVPEEVHRDKLLGYGECFREVVDGDVLFDEILSIEEVQPSHGYVYDFTVEGTRTFSLLSGIQLFDSFHTSGQQKVNLLSGIPRMEEIVNVTREIKTPSMEIWLALSDERLRNLSDVRSVALEVLEYHEIEDFLLDYDLTSERELDAEDEAWYELHRSFVGTEYEDCNWSIRLMFDTERIYAKRMTLSRIAETIQKAYGDTFCVVSPDNIGIIDVYIRTDELGDVHDVVESIKTTRRKTTKKDGASLENKTRVDLVEMLEAAEIEVEPKWVKKDMIRALQEAFPSRYGDDENIDLVLLINDENKEKYFLRDLVLPSIRYLHVGGIERIKEVFFQERGGQWYITTSGSNLKTVLAHPLVDAYRTITNHLWDTFECLGIEATRNFLRRELEKLISVGNRHIELLINTITYSGRPTPCTSRGIDIRQVGLLAKIGFETPWDYFFKAAHTTERDPMNSASSAIIAGKVPSLGSGQCQLRDEQSDLEIDEDGMIHKANMSMINSQANRNVSGDSRPRLVARGENADRVRPIVADGVDGKELLLSSRKIVPKRSNINAAIEPAPHIPELPVRRIAPKSRSLVTKLVIRPNSGVDETSKRELDRLGSVPRRLFGNSNGTVVEREFEQETY